MNLQESSIHYLNPHLAEKFLQGSIIGSLLTWIMQEYLALTQKSRSFKIMIILKAEKGCCEVAEERRGNGDCRKGSKISKKDFWVAWLEQREFFPNNMPEMDCPGRIKC